MIDVKPKFTDLAHRRQHQKALARSRGRDGAVDDIEPRELAPGEGESNALPLADAELVQLQIRVIALENVMIAILARGSDRQLELAREMADYISPRPGFTPHRLTIGAAEEMNSLVERAARFRRGPQSRGRR
jgi:hypothetical protein